MSKEKRDRSNEMKVRILKKEKEKKREMGVTKKESVCDAHVPGPRLLRGCVRKVLPF